MTTYIANAEMKAVSGIITSKVTSCDTLAGLTTLLLINVFAYLFAISDVI